MYPPPPHPTPPQPAGKQPNHFNYIPNGCNLHIATSQCCVSETSTTGLTFSEQTKSSSPAERGRTEKNEEPCSYGKSES